MQSPKAPALISMQAARPRPNIILVSSRHRPRPPSFGRGLVSFPRGCSRSSSPFLSLSLSLPHPRMSAQAHHSLSLSLSLPHPRTSVQAHHSLSLSLSLGHHHLFSLRMNPASAATTFGLGLDCHNTRPWTSPSASDLFPSGSAAIAPGLGLGCHNTQPRTSPWASDLFPSALAATTPGLGLGLPPQPL